MGQRGTSHLVEEPGSRLTGVNGERRGRGSTEVCSWRVESGFRWTVGHRPRRHREVRGRAGGRFPTVCLVAEFSS